MQSMEVFFSGHRGDGHRRAEHDPGGQMETMPSQGVKTGSQSVYTESTNTLYIWVGTGYISVVSQFHGRERLRKKMSKVVPQGEELMVKTRWRNTDLAQ